MKADVRRELSLDNFARSVNLSVWRLSHIFKSEMGVPPIKYLRLLRMERAKTLLETSFLSVKEIAHQVGVNDESHFVRDFKSTYGASPTLYRTRFLNKRNEEHAVQEHRTPLHDQITNIAKQNLLPSISLFLCLLALLDSV
ncbi:MAG TPA: helix-turn-helix transcriptional regulator [Pyrinomonadaceae bacterium]|nr:helix-turn-helix transcriptional regulator [Pyrinomonadaceae bacterium]